MDKGQVRTEQEIAALPVPDAESDLDYVMRAVSTIRRALYGRVPSIRFPGSPWTRAAYMVVGGPSQDFRHRKGMVYNLTLIPIRRCPRSRLC